MFLGNVVNRFIGLALTFGTAWLAVSSITVGFAPVLRRRSATLHSRMKQILKDDDLSGLAGALVTPGRAQTGR